MIKSVYNCSLLSKRIVTLKYVNLILIKMIQNNMQLYFEYGYYQIKYLFNYAIIALLVSFE